MKNIALIIIDIQKVFFCEEKYFLPNSEAAAKNAEKILSLWRRGRKTVIHVIHHFQLNEQLQYLNDIHEIVLPKDNQVIVEKRYPNSFFKTDLLRILNEKKISAVVIVGMMSNMCIDTTVRACKDYGIKVILIHDACAAKSIVFRNEKIPSDIVHKVFMGAMDEMFATVINTETLLSSYE
jgi:Amidases related to nicotinamidase